MFHFDTCIVRFIMKHYNEAGVSQMLYLKEIRLQKGKSQAEVAEFLKITRASYTNIENGKRDPDTATLLALSDYFGVSLDEIFGRGTQKIHFTAEEIRLVKDFRSLTREGQDEILDYVAYVVGKGIYKNNPAVSDEKKFG